MNGALSDLRFYNRALTSSEVTELSLGSGGPIYVSTAATGGLNNGSSWSNAFTSLSDALTEANRVANIGVSVDLWVAAGVYYPDEGDTVSDDDPSSSFVITNDINIYGGFAGTETELSQRDVETNATIFSGDIEQNDTTSNGVVVSYGDISGTNSYHVLVVSNATCRIDGVTVTGGKSDANASEQDGSAVFLNEGALTLANSIIQGNHAAEYGFGAIGLKNATCRIDGATITGGKTSGTGSQQNGAALFLSEAQLTLVNSTVRGNDATGTGRGAIHQNNADLTVESCNFLHNRSFYGGAISALRTSGTRTLTITDSVFTDNEALESGGVLYVDGATSIDVTGSLFMQNSSASSGGAAQLWSAGSGHWKKTSFIGNSAPTGGGAILSLLGSGQTFETALFSGNYTYGRGGAIYNYNSPISVINSTFQGNRNQGSYGGIQEAGGVFLSDIGNKAEVFENTILWGNIGESAGTNAPVEQVEIEDTGASPPVFRFCTIQGSGGSGSWQLPGGTDGGGNIDADPLFIAPTDPFSAPTTTGDARLGVGSPCVNAGTNGVVTVQTDLDGNDRILYGTVDVGAYEHVDPPPVPTLQAPEMSGSGSFFVSIFFSESVTGFDAGDITVVNGAVNYAAGVGDAYVAEIQPWSEGSLVMSIAAGVVTDSVGNTNVASTTATTVVYFAPPLIIPQTQDQTVLFQTTCLTVTGASFQVHGDLQWSNQLTMASGIAEGVDAWSLGCVALSVGTNIVEIMGENGAGITTTNVTLIRRDFLPEIVDVTFESSSGMQLSWTSNSNVVFGIDQSTDLVSGEWVPLTGFESVTGAPPVNLITIPVNTSTHQAFYRIRIQNYLSP